MNATNTAASAAANPYMQTPAASSAGVSPTAAFVLGLIPGVGAIYNGQYAKGLVHALIFGLLISMANAAHDGSGEPLMAMMAFAFFAYMPFEAFHTAKKRQAGIPVEEWSSLIDSNHFIARAPILPILLILLGILFLLDSFNLIQFRELTRFWPVLLILAGIVMLYNRLTAARGNRQAHSSVESAHEQ